MMSSTGTSLPAAGPFVDRDGDSARHEEELPLRASYDPHPIEETRDDGLEEEYGAMYPLLFALAAGRFAVPRDEAAALVHDVFVAYLRNRDRVLERRPWLIGATCNAARLYWRRKRRVASTLADLPAPALSLDLDRRIAAAQAIHHLRPRCRELLRLRFVDEYSSAALASHLGTTVAYARKLVYQCMAALRRLMET